MADCQVLGQHLVRSALYPIVHPEGTIAEAHAFLLNTDPTIAPFCPQSIVRAEHLLDLQISQPVPLMKDETKTLTSNMPSMNWKTFIADRLYSTAGIQNTSVFTEAWSPKESHDQRFETLTADPDMALFAADSNKKKSF
jgi:hypothetical protein